LKEAGPWFLLQKRLFMNNTMAKSILFNSILCAFLTGAAFGMKEPSDSKDKSLALIPQGDINFFVRCKKTHHLYLIREQSEFTTIEELEVLNKILKPFDMTAPIHDFTMTLDKSNVIIEHIKKDDNNPLSLT